MYIMDEIRYLYESSVPGSVDYAISEYLLTHLDTIGESTLTSIAENAGVVKSALSKYIARLTKRTSFSAFKESLKLEKEYVEMHTSKKVFHDQAMQYLKREKLYHKSCIEEVRQFVEDIQQVNDILILSAEDYISCFSPFVALCLEDHKRIRTQVFTRSSFEHTGSQELVLFVDPFRSPYDFQMLASMDYEMTAIMKTRRKYFIGRNDNRDYSMQVFTVQESNTFLIQKRLMQLCAEMIVGYTQLFCGMSERGSCQIPLCSSFACY